MDSRKLILISVIIFITSLFFDALTFEDLHGIGSYSSLTLFLIGPIGFLGGGILEFFIWTANGWLLVSMISAYKKNYFLANLSGIIAALISGSFIFWENILVSESGRTAEIHSLEEGYFLWLTSILVMMILAVYLNWQSKRNIK
ncbi:hypothetical protein CHRYSEOSP005_20090 [Chryseobacterium sp. Alg-005]|uniref:hypothetical protein n=1 Tax=Chryseobacterium sp. Alg-005 TaxID=3159516 RepID=UPI003555815D